MVFARHMVATIVVLSHDAIVLTCLLLSLMIAANTSIVVTGVGRAFVCLQMAKLPGIRNDGTAHRSTEICMSNFSTLFFKNPWIKQRYNNVMKTFQHPNILSRYKNAFQS